MADAEKTFKQVCVIGLGYIGLPTACLLADSGYEVLGVDIDIAIINRIQSKRLMNSEPNLQELLCSAIESGRFKVSTEIAPADVYIIAVPTPLATNNQPDVSYVEAVIDVLGPYLRPNNLILIESTCPIGTTEIIGKQLRSTCTDVRVAYCPERVLPGNLLNELIRNDRVVGGIDETSTLHTVEFYQSFIQGNIYATNARTAEAVKLAENIYRDINIAYANELSIIADHLNINIDELIFLANKHPRVQILKPGPGVGGHCIAVDPWFLIASAPEFSLLTLKAREVNIAKTEWVVQKIRDSIIKNKASIIACLGLTYKPDVVDLRESPALKVVKALEKDIEVLRVDPYVLDDTETLDNALARAQIIVGLVPHQSFRSIAPAKIAGKIILDFGGVFK